MQPNPCTFCEQQMKEVAKANEALENMRALARSVGVAKGHDTMYVVVQNVNGALSYRTPDKLDTNKVKVIDTLYVFPTA